MRSGFLVLSLAALVAPSLGGATLAQGASEPSAPEWLDGSVRAAFGALTAARVAGDFGVHRAPLAGSERTAQDLRDAYAALAARGQGAAFLAGLEAALEERIAGALAAVFPRATVEVERVAVDATSLAAPPGPAPTHPPVRFAFEASVAYDLEGLGLGGGALALTEEKVRAALDLGAVVTLPANLSAPAGWNLTLALEPPAGLRIAAAEGAVLAQDGASATWDLRNWLGEARLPLPSSLALQSRAAPAMLATDARVALSVDMADVVGLTLPGALQGDFGELLVRFEARVLLRALRLADLPALEAQLLPRLPAALAIPGVNADGLRLAEREGLLPSDALQRLEAHFRRLAAERLAALGAEGVALEGGPEPGSLDPAHISSPLDGEPPLAYRVGASFRIPLAAPEGSRLAAATGAALLQRSLSLSLPRLLGLDTTYTITLPQGIALVDVAPEGARYELGEREGRDVVVVTPEGDDARATFTIAVTTDFVLAKFWYLWLGVVVLVAAGVALAFLRRLRRRGKLATPAEPPPSEPVAATRLAAPEGPRGDAQGPLAPR